MTIRLKTSTKAYYRHTPREETFTGDAHKGNAVSGRDFDEVVADDNIPVQAIRAATDDGVLAAIDNLVASHEHFAGAKAFLRITVGPVSQPDGVAADMFKDVVFKQGAMPLETNSRSARDSGGSPSLPRVAPASAFPSWSLGTSAALFDDSASSVSYLRVSPPPVLTSITS